MRLKNWTPRHWGILVLTVLLVAAGWHGLIQPRLALRACKTTLRAAGVPLTLADCAVPVVKENQEAARRFLAAAQKLPTKSKVLPASAPRAMAMVAPGQALVGWKQPELPMPPALSANYSRLLLQRYGLQVAPTVPDSAPAPQPTWEELAAELGAQAATLQEIREVTLTAGFDWETDYSAGFNTELGHLSECKRVVEWLQAGTLLALHEDRLEDALALLETQLRIVRNLPRNGLLIDQLVRIAMGGIAWNTTWEALQAEGWTDAQLARVQQAWEEVEFVETMSHALEMERALALEELDRCRQSTARWTEVVAPSENSSAGGSPSGGFLDQLMEWIRGQSSRRGGWVPAKVWAWFRSWDDERWLIEAMQSMIDQANDRVVSARPPRDLPLRLPAGETFVPPDAVPDRTSLGGYRFTARFLPPIGSALAKGFHAQMLREMALAGVALERHRRQRGSLPEQLEELVPEFLADVPFDWLDGRALRYRRLEQHRFLLYSVGRNGVDNGGNPQPPEHPSRNAGYSSPSPYSALDFVWPDAVASTNALR